MDASEPKVLPRAGLDSLIDALRAKGFTVVGPTLQSETIAYGELESAADLAVGWRDEQDGGTYRLVQRDDDAVFGHNDGHNSLKSFLFPAALQVWKAQQGPDGELQVEPPPEPPRYAFIGVRSCDLHAVAIQDRVFMGGKHVESDYAARRSDAFVVAVNCGQACGTCFCVSMNTGPKVESGYDLALTELLEGGQHRFLVEVGSERGDELLAELEHGPAEEADRRGAEAATENAKATQGRELDTTDLRDLLVANLEHPRWDEVADRCLSCGNCTLVCPTCFCSTTEDVTDLAGGETERTRLWDSCFSLDHSYIHGGSVRGANRSRYRQWMTHKLATWIDQFGTSGCVGCGRCITWCPVAIDITEETAAIRADDMREADE